MQQYSFVDYAWSPNFMISDTAIGNPVVWPDTITWYYLQLSDTMGNISYDSVLVDVQVCLGVEPTQTSLQWVKVYPNPANNNITIPYYIPKKSNAIIEIIDISGKIVQSYNLGQIPIGSHKQIINTTNMEIGVYFYRLRTDYESLQKRMIIIR